MTSPRVAQSWGNGESLSIKQAQRTAALGRKRTLRIGFREARSGLQRKVCFRPEADTVLIAQSFDGRGEEIRHSNEARLLR
ncbi:MAG: hypothetical protein AMJ65_07985 [Phycisphaerae bacterium SG8_4]|nr:MAG: hypothetical protein AMJ65_07985 [Phycisphaerae bacterium SG8_4]